MTILILGLALFLGVHSVSIVAPAWRDRTAAQLGPKWRGVYSLVALVGLVLIIYGYGQARHAPIVVYVPPAWTRRVTDVLMLPFFPLLLAAYLPCRINRALKHPMLVAVKLWAFAHLLANGMLADLFLFGGFLAWAVADRISLKRRPPRAIAMAAPSEFNDLVAIVVGLTMYAVMVIWAHAALIGVLPI